VRLLKAFVAVLAAALCASAQTMRLTAPVPSFAAPAMAIPAFAPAALQGLTPLLSPSIALSPALAAPAQAAFKLILPGNPAPAAPSAADAPDFEAGHYGAMFDGAAVGGPEGEKVSPRLVAAQEATLRLPLQAAVVRGAVERALPALRESVALGSWSGPHTTLDESCCGDAAPKLAALLRARGIPARLVEAEFHYYVILDLPEGQLVVDPTIRQFFGKKGAPRSVPAVFVGTIGELTNLFHHHAPAKTTRYDVHRIYFSEAETREEYLRKTIADIHLGGVRDLEPLRREMGLPPSAIPKAERPRLLVP